MSDLTCVLCRERRMGLCLILDEKRDKEDPICGNFSVRDFHWCLRSHAWLDTIVCIARRAKGSEGCAGCKQGQSIVEAKRHNSRRSRTRRTQEIES
jgi:hypothetical protein